MRDRFAFAEGSGYFHRDKDGEIGHTGTVIALEQGQLWKQGEKYFRIVVWERLAIQYKETDSPDAEEGTVHDVSKKEFCRLIKGAELVV